MGCGMSTENDGGGQEPASRVDNADNSQSTGPNVNKAQKKGDQKGVRDDFTDVVNPAPVEDDIEDEDPFEFSLEELPPYSKINKKPPKDDGKTNKSAEGILNTVRKAHRMQKYGINGAFSVLGERHIHVWIDASYLLSRDTKIAIQLQAVQHLQLGQATESDMTFFFTSYPNLLSEKLTEGERKLLYQLIRIWETSSWSKAEEMVDRNEILSGHFKLRDWMKDTENFKPKKKEGEVEQVKQAGQRKDEEQEGQRKDEASKMSPDEKHTILLAHVRDLMLPYWHGWHQRDFAGISDLILLCKEARQAALRQRKSLNSICIMYLREIGLYLRLREQKQAYPLTCFPLIGSMMQSGEVDTIKDYQQVNNHKLKKQLTNLPPPKKPIWHIGGAPSPAVEATEDKIDPAERRDLPFQITGMVDIEKMSDDGVKGFDDIDNAFSGKDDINDIKKYMHTMYLKFFFSALTLFLYYNAHNKDVDDVELSREEMYGDLALTTTTDGKISIPHVTDYMKILGRDVDDWVQPKSKIQVVDYSNLDAEKVSIRALAAQ